MSIGIDELNEAFLAGVEAAAKHIETHSCVASCCNAQPSANEAHALATCIRTAVVVPVCEKKKNYDVLDDDNPWYYNKRR